jgi:peptide/nickel transport system permease protein
MIAGGRDLIVVAPWVAIAPGLALVLTVVCCTVLGDALHDRLAGVAERARAPLLERAPAAAVSARGS